MTIDTPITERGYAPVEARMREAYGVRIAYLLAWRGGADSGPFRKMASQVRTWQEAGHEVGLFVATSSSGYDDWRGMPANHHHVSLAEGGGSKFAERQRLASAAADWSPDVIYERHGLYYPGHARISRRFPVVTEINANDVHEWPLLSKTKSAYNRLTRTRGLSGLAGLVFVTHELSQAPEFRRFSDATPSLVLGNGIDLDSIPRAPVKTINGSPRVVFVGHHSSPWHGIDDLLALARSRRDWRFDVIGLRDAQLTGATQNVVAHGQLLPSDYQSVIAAADVGVGSLGLHLERINEASTLKVREYLAAGLPVILGGKDTDFPKGAPFLLEVPNVAGGVLSVPEAVDEFVRRWRGQRVDRGAVGHLDVAVKERVRLEFFEQVRRPSAR